MNIIIDNQCFPCTEYIKEVTEYKNIELELYDVFKKMSFQNRYIIAGANNLINLTVPIAGGREQKTLMKEVRIDNSTNWQMKHWRSLTSAYNKAPFFEFYSQDVKRLLFSNEEFLFRFNLKVLEWIFIILKIDSAINFTESFIAHYEDATDYRNYFLPRSFQNSTNNFLSYSQVFENRLGFQPNLSILDLLFCEGPNARHLLNQFTK